MADQIDVVVRRGTVTRLILACLVLEVAFVILDGYLNLGLGTRISALRQLFNIASEDGLASWYASAQTLMIALTLWGIRFCARRDPQSSAAGRRGWLVLAVLFTWMAFDDGAQIHERLGTTFDDLLEAGTQAGTSSWLGRAVALFPSYVWQVSVLPVLGVAAVVGFGLVWRALGERRLRLLILVGLGCLFVAEGLDFFEGLDENHPWNLYTMISQHFAIEPWTVFHLHRSAYDTLEHVSKMIEEYLEMLGATLLWLAFLRYLTGIAGALRIRLN
jgi:hypothetical protein